MGLDMHLYRQQYVRPESEDALELMGKEEGSLVFVKVPTMLYEEIGYWRKANHIHGWFVEHAQQGNDDCQMHEVGYQQLEELLDVVQDVLRHSKLVPGDVTVGYTYTDGEEKPIIEHGRVIADPTVAKNRLPRMQGFFFGGYDYDEYYVYDLKETEDILQRALQFGSDSYFYYQSSW